jgi:hypothetical protein
MGKQDFMPFGKAKEEMWVPDSNRLCSESRRGSTLLWKNHIAVLTVQRLFRMVSLAVFDLYLTRQLRELEGGYIGFN